MSERRHQELVKLIRERYEYWKGEQEKHREEMRTFNRWSREFDDANIDALRCEEVASELWMLLKNDADMNGEKFDLDTDSAEDDQ